MTPLIFFAKIYSKRFELQRRKFSKKFVYILQRKPSMVNSTAISLQHLDAFIIFVYICIIYIYIAPKRHSKIYIVFIFTRTVLIHFPFTMIKFMTVWAIPFTIYLLVCFLIADSLHGTIQFHIQHCHMLS